MKTAQILIVGDEILSGRTADSNSHFLAKALGERGVRVQRIEVVSDNEVLISQWINKNHGLSDFVFVCGGIGGTPDDVTRVAVARAFGVPLVRNQAAEKILLDHYKEKVNEDRMSMADLPDGCTLIDNSVTRAPGFKFKNVYVFAGIPQILHAMWLAIQNEISGPTLFEKEIDLKVGEGEISKHMKVLNKEFPLLELGSYPNMDAGKGYRTQLVFRSEKKEVVNDAVDRFRALYKE